MCRAIELDIICDPSVPTDRQFTVVSIAIDQGEIPGFISGKATAFLQEDEIRLQQGDKEYCCRGSIPKQEN